MTLIDHRELERRSILGFGEMLAALGRWNVGADAVVRRYDAIGARIDAASDNHWYDAAVVPFDARPPADDPLLPHCLWTVADSVPERVEDTEIATPCMGIAFDDLKLTLANGTPNVETPSLEVLGDLNERAYGETGFSPLLRVVRDDRIRTYGLCDNGAFVCVALTLTNGDDVSIQYVATEASYRRRGLASQLLLAILAAAREEGKQSATLQASADGLSVYERLGFHRVATLRGYLRRLSTCRIQAYTALAKNEYDIRPSQPSRHDCTVNGGLGVAGGCSEPGDV